MRVVYEFLSAFLITGILSSCVHQPPRAPASYLSVDLPLSRYEKIRHTLEAKFAQPLKHRGEAHITLITPPEYKILQSQISFDELYKTAEEMNIFSTPPEPLCIGEGAATKHPELGKTYYVVVASKKFLEFRQKVEGLFVARGGKKGAFQATLFYPHITLGFTHRDLHLEDGVIKDLTTCLKPDPISDLKDDQIRP